MASERLESLTKCRRQRGEEMSEPTIPKGFVMIYTDTHSICMRVDHIVSVAVACGSCGVNHTLHITTRDGENYKAAYNFEEFLKIMAEEGDKNDGRQ